MTKQIVIMPGGFHPFHAGHLALYQAAKEAFPGAEVYVAATDDTSTRPFPFAVKEKLAKLAGVEPGHFVRVKSPFRAQEITAGFDPARDQLIFVRSEKDKGSQPQPGGFKRDGSPGYLQPYTGPDMKPFAQHAYMAYLPTVEFGPGLRSATEIRTAWPRLNDQRKTALVMSLYPRTQNNPRLAATVVKLLDAAIVGEQSVAEASREPEPRPVQVRGALSPELERDPELRAAKLHARQHYSKYADDPQMAFEKWVQRSLQHGLEDDQKQFKLLQGMAKKIQQLERKVRDLEASAPVSESTDYANESDSAPDHL